MSSIGGYFGLELAKGSNAYHTSPYKLKSGRASISFLLKHLKPRRVYVPFYTCNALLEPFIENNVSFIFYAINNRFEIENIPSLKNGELLVYINYYGLKDKYVELLSDKYKDSLIVDCTQSYFTKGNGWSWFFNSSRKFFGVPDGSDLYIPNRYDMEDLYQDLPVNEQYITDHLIARFNGNTAQGYPYFQENEVLNGGLPSKMSVLTKYLLSHVNFEKVKAIRIENFHYLHNFLKATNRLDIAVNTSWAPFFYPYLPEQPLDKEKFWAANIFVPVFWKDCLRRHDSEKFKIEKELCEKLIPIPVDHRYSYLHFQHILTFIANK